MSPSDASGGQEPLELDLEPIKARLADAPENIRVELNDPLYSYCTLQSAEGRIAEMWGREGRIQFFVYASADITALVAELERLRSLPSPPSSPDRLLLLARFGARIAHENMFDAAVNIDEEPTEGHENNGGPSWGFDTCPHGDCVMVRLKSAGVPPPLPSDRREHGAQEPSGIQVESKLASPCPSDADRGTP